jgi:uroporphyrinogen-III synthase
MGIPWPAIGIDDQEPDPTALAAVASAEPSDLAIFVSRNAVARGAPLLNRKRLPRIAAIGPSTRRALEAAALPTSFDSEGYDTEALLAHPEMAELSGGRVFIFRGVGGRETLGEQLRVRGGRVRYIEVYRRRPRASAPAERAGLLRQCGSALCGSGRRVLLAAGGNAAGDRESSCGTKIERIAAPGRAHSRAGTG